jgi:hypothetical protein
MSGIDYESEKKANELEEEIFEMAKNGSMPKIDGSCLKNFEPKQFKFGIDEKGRNKMSVIDEIVDILKEDDGAWIPRPASDEDIAGCNESLIELGLEPLPQGYIDFLKKYNGLAWNGIIFYSTDIVTEAGNPNGFKLMDLVSMNDDFNDRYELDEKVLLGRADEDYYTYNIETKKYEALELESREVWEECDTFENLFFFTVGGRLGLMNDEEK